MAKINEKYEAMVVFSAKNGEEAVKELEALIMSNFSDIE